MGARHRLLVIDYEPRSLERTLALLQGAGFAVSSGRNALEITTELNRATPDAAIVEPMIPGQDGFKLIQTIKRLRPERPTFVIAASRIYRGPRFRGMAKEAGADLFVERPAQDDQILAALTRALGEQPEPTAPVPPEEMSSAGSAVAPMAAVPTPPAIAARRPPAVPIPRPAAPVPRASTSVPGRAVPAAATGPSFCEARPHLSSQIPVVPSSDAEIDAALDRLLGPFGAVSAAAPAPAPAIRTAPPAPSAAPGTLDAADPLGLSVDEGSRSRRAEPRGVTGPLAAFDLDDVVGGEPSPPVVIPTAVEAEHSATPPAVSVAENALGFDLMTGDSDGISAPAALEDARESRYVDYLLQEEPGTGPPPLDSNFPFRTGPIAAIAPESPIPSADDDIDRVLARVFAPGVGSHGTIPGIDADSRPAQHVSGVVGDQGHQASGPVPDEPTPARPVPEGLRGMDAGTADLLSSLAEFESSLPDGGPPSSDLRVDSTWTATAGFGDLTGQALQEIETSVPVTPPPSPEDEQTLQDVLSKINMEAQPTAEEVDPVLASPPVQFEGFRPTGAPCAVRGRTGPATFSRGNAPIVEVPIARPPVPDAIAVSSRVLLTGALVAVLLLALAAGGWFLLGRETAAPPETPTARKATSGGEPMRFPAAPTPAAGVRKPRLKRPGAGPNPGVTRPGPRGDGKAPDSGRASDGPASSGTPQTPVAVIPALVSPGPVPATMRTPPRDPAPPAERSMSAADTRMSAADITASAPATSPPAAPETTAAGEATEPEGTTIVRASELDAPIRSTNRPVPPPTAEAIAARTGGRAFLNVLVGGDGSVQDVRLMIDPGHGLGEAARHAAQAWRYTAPSHEGQPVRVWKTEVVEFEVPAGEEAESR